MSLIFAKQPFKLKVWKIPTRMSIHLMPMTFKDKKGFSLVEMMIAATIFILAFASILISYLKCLDLNDLSKNSSIALRAAKACFEQIKDTSFNQIKTNYDNVSFATSGLNGKGVSYVDDTNPKLLKITISVSWKQPNGRVVGEDANLNGVLNAGEDKNGNGLLDSPVEIVTYLFD